MKTLAKRTTKFGSYAIVDQTYNGRPARILYAGHATPQSGMARDDEPELLFDYIQRLYEIVLSMKPERVLIIGGGAFVLPRAIIERTDVAHVDVVEIDDGLPAIAQEFFDLPADDPRLSIYAMDGLAFLATSSERYDLIVIDAFSEYDIPENLMNESAAKMFANHLTDDGVLAMNYIGYVRGFRSRETRRLAMNFQTQLPYVTLFPADPEDDIAGEHNLIVTASARPLPDFDYLQATAQDVPS